MFVTRQDVEAVIKVRRQVLLTGLSFCLLKDHYFRCKCDLERIDHLLCGAMFFSQNSEQLNISGFQ